MFYGMGLITGLILGYLLGIFIHAVKKGIRIKLFGCEINITRNEKTEPDKSKYKKLNLNC